MQVEQILQELLSKTIHATRIATMIELITGLIECKNLKLTSLGRALPNTEKERAGILRVNRFLSNKYYQTQSIALYECMTQFVLAYDPKPEIIVDWSSLPQSHYKTQGGEHLILRASYAAEGRAITLYEEVHPKKRENNPKVHRDFLKKLQSILPTHCVPCLITDAGFKVPWFKAVVAMGWDYIGRMACGSSFYDAGQGFQKGITLFKLATKQPKFLGSYLLTKENQFRTNFYIYKAKPKGKHKWTKTAPRKIARDKDSKKHSKSHREPWVLVSSLGKNSNSSKKVIEKYKKRMTIEEAFRDIKSTEYGLSMNDNVTILPQRYIVWLMLAALTCLIAWIVGFAAEKKGLHFHFQANSYKHRRVLSFFFLGCQIIKKNRLIIFNLEEIRLQAWGGSSS